MIKSSLPLRILTTSFVVLALPLLIYSFIFFQKNYYDSVREAKMHIKQMADFRSFALGEITPRREILLNELTYFLDLPTKMATGHLSDLNNQLADLSQLIGGAEILVLDVKDPATPIIVAASEKALVNQKLSDLLGVHHALEKGKGAVIRFTYSTLMNQYAPQMYSARVIYKPGSQELLGMLLITAQVHKDLQAIFSEKQEESAFSVQFALLDPNGVAFMATDKAFLGEHIKTLSSREIHEFMDLEKTIPFSFASQPMTIVRQEPPFFEFIFKDQIQIGYLARIANESLSLFAYVPKEVFFAKAVRHFLILYTSYGLILTCGVIASFFLSNWIASPLKQLSTVMGEVGKGNLLVRFRQENLGFEINELGSIFNQTLEQLLTNIQRATEEKVKKQTYQHEVDVGRSAQTQFFPENISQIFNVKLAGLFVPGEIVGGDLYGWRMNENGGIHLGLVDAPEKGIPACLHALSARSLLRSYSIIYDDPQIVLRKTNETLCDEMADSGVFIRSFFGYFDTKTNLFSYYSSGSPPGLIRRAHGQVDHLRRGGVALGVQREAPIETETVQLAPGDTLLFFSDGLLSAMNSKNQHFSERRLIQLLQENVWATPEKMLESIKEAHAAFTGGVPQEDEFVMIAMMVT